MFCEKCGSKMSMDAMFCNNCGAKVNTVDNHVVVEEKPVYNPQPVVVEMNSEVEVSVQQQAKTITNKPKNKKKGIIIGVVAGVIAIAVAVVSVLFFTGAFDYTGEYYDVENQVIYDENGQPIYDENSQTIYDENSQPNSAEQSINFPNQEYYYVPGESMMPQSTVEIISTASYYTEEKDYVETKETVIELPTIPILEKYNLNQYSWVFSAFIVREYNSRVYVKIEFESEGGGDNIEIWLAYNSSDLSLDNLVMGDIYICVGFTKVDVTFVPNGKAVYSDENGTETLMSGFKNVDYTYFTDVYGNTISYDEYSKEEERIMDWFENEFGEHLKWNAKPLDEYYIWVG